MSCTRCGELDLTSDVYELDVSEPVVLGAIGFTDEDGEQHVHYAQPRVGTYRCSEGHRFQRSWKIACDVAGCGYGEKNPETVPEPERK